MTTKEQSTPTQAGIEEQLRTAHLEPFYAFFAFPVRYQRDVIIGLRVAAAVIPTDDELYRARDQGGSVGWNIDKRYGNAADAFARAINPDFDPKVIYDGDSKMQEVIELRTIFYSMISSLSSGQVKQGARILGQLEPSLQRPAA